MTNKFGADSRHKHLFFRVDEAQHSFIKELARQREMTISQYIRWCLSQSPAELEL